MLTRRRSALAAVSLASLASLALALASCEDVRSYVYTAMAYDPVNACVNAYAPVEVVQGEGASATCAPICLTVGSTLYVSTMCPPLPDIATAVPDDAAACQQALDAEAQEASCGGGSGDDGGCEAGDDGGGEAGDDGGGEAGDDGGDDASADAPGDAPADVRDEG